MSKEDVLHMLRNEIKEVPIDEDAIELPPDPDMGNYAFPCFSLAKTMKMAPPKIAEGLAKSLVPHGMVESVTNNGPYLNFFLNKSKLAENTLIKVAKEKAKYGKSRDDKTIIIEHTSPNTNKPLHLGHVRNMLLGHAVATISSFTGNKVKQVTVNNDRGVHICKSMLAYQKFGSGETPESTGLKSDHFVGKYYVVYAQKQEEHPELDEEIKEVLRKYEADDKEIIALWKQMNAWAFDGFAQTFKRAGISFDKQYYESEYFNDAKDIVKAAFDKGILAKDDTGNIIADLEDKNLGVKVLLRADGTAVYATQDMQLAVLKFKDFKPDKSIYVVGSEQDHQFKQLFAIFEKLGFTFAETCYHLSYGMVHLPEGRMKSREGTVVDADDLIDEVVALAKGEILLRHKTLDANEVDKRAEVIGLGALKFLMLKNDPKRDMVFDPKESVSFEGETGPYIQYAHARICSILRKYGKGVEAHVDWKKIWTPEEVALVRSLSGFQVKVTEAATHYKPSIVAHYLIELAQQFNEFYHRRQVLHESVDEETKKARILLIDCVRQVLKNGLILLGIDAPEEM